MATDYVIVVLFDGYSKINELGTEMEANCTCTLIKGPKNIIVDTMTAWDGEKIKNALKNNNLSPENIDWVICTHGHSDHIGNNSLFLNATHIVGTSISKKDKYYLHDFEKNPEYILDEKIKVLFTPGHTLSDVSVIVDTPKNYLGVVAITGDLFEKFEDIFNENIWLEAGSESPELQLRNRNLIIYLADNIIPGHGPLFNVTEEIKQIN